MCMCVVWHVLVVVAYLTYAHNCNNVQVQRAQCASAEQTDRVATRACFGAYFAIAHARRRIFLQC